MHIESCGETSMQCRSHRTTTGCQTTVCTWSCATSPGSRRLAFSGVGARHAAWSSASRPPGRIASSTPSRRGRRQLRIAQGRRSRCQSFGGERELPASSCRTEAPCGIPAEVHRSLGPRSQGAGRRASGPPVSSRRTDTPCGIPVLGPRVLGPAVRAANRLSVGFMKRKTWSLLDLIIVATVVGASFGSSLSPLVQ